MNKINDLYNQKVKSIEAKRETLFTRFQDMVRKNGETSLFISSGRLTATDSQQKWYDKETAKLRSERALLDKARDDAVKKTYEKWNNIAIRNKLK